MRDESDLVFRFTLHPSSFHLHPFLNVRAETSEYTHRPHVANFRPCR